MIPAGIAAITLFVFIGGTITQLLWNWLLPPLFGWKELSFWQALGMLMLCRILFGGMAGRGGHGRRTSNWTPEEKARFRQRLRERCFGPEPPPPAGAAAP
jgi:hypothetical protein